MKTNKWSYLFFILILCDIAFTFLQNYHWMQLDGDLCSIIMPSEGYRKVLTDPFGLSVITNNEYYPATNRFFIHFFMRLYFFNVPQLIQYFTDPVESIYLSITLVPTMIQVILIYLLSSYASGSGSIFNKNFLIAAIIITPLFQVMGYNEWMGITVGSITYTFFYGFSFIFILLYFMPFYKIYFLEKKIRFTLLLHFLVLIGLMIISFGGPLGPPTMLLVCPTILIYFIIKFLRQNPGLPLVKRGFAAIRSIPKPLLFHFSVAIILCLYSSYLGTHNSENSWFSKPLGERYLLLREGFWRIVSFKLGFPIMFFTCIANTIFISRSNENISRKIVLATKIICLLSLVYVLMLPLGGYRGYRPLILRCDTFAPVVIAFMLLFGLSGLYLLNYFKSNAKKIYVSVMVIIVLIYTNADGINWTSNDCQRENLEAIAKSKDPVVKLPNWCSILSWGRNPSAQDSEFNARLLKIWNVTDEVKLHYYPYYD